MYSFFVSISDRDVRFSSTSKSAHFDDFSPLFSVHIRKSSVFSRMDLKDHMVLLD